MAKQLESHMGNGKGGVLCGEPDAYIVDTSITAPDWSSVSCERCLAHKDPRMVVEEASTLGLQGFPSTFALDGVTMPRIRLERDEEGDITVGVYRLPDGGEFHILND